MYRLLIADDEETIRKGLKKLIISYHLNLSQIYLARDSEEAIDIIKKISIWNYLYGYQHAFYEWSWSNRKTRAVNPEAKIIIISGYDHFEYAQKALDLEFISIFKAYIFPKFENCSTWCNRIIWKKSKSIFGWKGIKSREFEFKHWANVSDVSNC